MKELVVDKTAIINTTTESVPTRTAIAKMTMKTSGKMELFYMFQVPGISGEKGVDTELDEILLIKCEESNRSVQLRDSVFMKQLGFQRQVSQVRCVLYLAGLATGPGCFAWSGPYVSENQTENIYGKLVQHDCAVER